MVRRLEDFQVLKHGVGQFDAGAPALPVQQFGLDPAPEGLDHRVVVAVADRAHRRQQARGAGPIGEHPGCELGGFNRWLKPTVFASLKGAGTHSV